MKTTDAVDLNRLPELRWMENGQSALTGKLLVLENKLEDLFLSWAAAWGASEYRFPTFIPAAELGKMDYFRSFPHLVTFPVTLDPDEENLRRFCSQEALNDQGEIRLTSTAPIRDALTPAACYHFYVHFQGETLDGPMYVTTRATCFRREAYYAPLQRQWCFSMREIVCIGTAEEVREFLQRMRDHIDGFFRQVGLPIEWQHATDSFFNPSRSPKYLMQKLEPVKTEMVFQDHLAIGSINFHQDHFGEAFHMRRDGKEAFSGCVAFGLERWLYAWLSHFGADPGGWPEMTR